MESYMEEELMKYLKTLQGLKGNLRPDQLELVESMEKNKNPNDSLDQYKKCLYCDKLLNQTLEDLDLIKNTTMFIGDYRQALKDSIEFEIDQLPKCDEKKLAENISKLVLKYDTKVLDLINLESCQQKILTEVLKEGNSKALQNFKVEQERIRKEKEDQRVTEENSLEEIGE